MLAMPLVTQEANSTLGSISHTETPSVAKDNSVHVCLAKDISNRPRRKKKKPMLHPDPNVLGQKDMKNISEKRSESPHLHWRLLL